MSLTDKQIDEKYLNLYRFCLEQFTHNPYQHEIMDLINKSKLAIKSIDTKLPDDKKLTNIATQKPSPPEF